MGGIAFSPEAQRWLTPRASAVFFEDGVKPVARNLLCLCHPPSRPPGEQLRGGDGPRSRVLEEAEPLSSR